jgi:hypothetical protein
MLLAELDLSALSNEVIDSLITGLHYELVRRKALKPVSKPKPLHRKFDQLQRRFGFRTHEEEIAYLSTLYSSALYALPQEVRHKKLKDRMEYLPILLSQDWTSLFPHADAEMSTYYVYAHVDPRKRPAVLPPMNAVLNGEPFYIGKGSGQRAWDLKRNQGHGKRITALRNLGHADTALVSLVAETLTERDALVIEAKLIYFFGSVYDEATHGYLLNLADHMRPVFTQPMKKLPKVEPYYNYLQHLASDATRATNHSS